MHHNLHIPLNPFRDLPLDYTPFITCTTTPDLHEVSQIRPGLLWIQLRTT